jgi:hypothetical protein
MLALVFVFPFCFDPSLVGGCGKGKGKKGKGNDLTQKLTACNQSAQWMQSEE